LYILYDFENTWRKNYVKRFNECIPHEYTKKNGKKIGWHESDIEDLPFDTNTENADNLDNDFSEINDFNFLSNIIKTIIKSTSEKKDSPDSVECVPVLLSGDTIGYFYPTRSLIEVGSLLSGEALRPIKKEARNLRKGDLILIRLSGRDLIRDKADELLKLEKKVQLREISSIWKLALKKFSDNKSIYQVCTALNDAGANCHPQQVQYWIYGDTICPNDINVLSAIKSLSNIEDFQRSVNDVFEAGKEIQGYHVRAGRWLSSELRSKANEIREIIHNAGFIAKGQIEGIGEIYIYTVEDVFEKQYVSKNKINKLEGLD
jgi:hypothetical protein